MPDPNFGPTEDTDADTDPTPDGHQDDTGQHDGYHGPAEDLKKTYQDDDHYGPVEDFETADQMTDAEIPDDEAIHEWNDPVVGYLIVEVNTGWGDTRSVFAKEIVQGPEGTQIGVGDGDGIREHYELSDEATIVGTIPAPDGIFQRTSEDEPNGKIRPDKIITPGETTIRRADQPKDDE